MKSIIILIMLVVCAQAQLQKKVRPQDLTPETKTMIVDSAKAVVVDSFTVHDAQLRSEMPDSAMVVVSDSLAVLRAAGLTDYDSIRAITNDTSNVLRVEWKTSIADTIDAYFPVTNANLAGSITDTKLSQITTANKVAGSAVQLNSGGSITNSTGLKIADNKVSWSMADPALKDSIRAGYGGTPTFVNNPGGITIEDAGTDSLEVVNNSIGKTKIDSLYLQQLNFEKAFPFIDTTGTNYDAMNRLIVDIQLSGSTDFTTGYGMTIPIVQRNNSGTWYIRVYKHLTLVCQFYATSSPENGDSITVHALSEYSGSGVSGYVAVNWTKITDGANWSNMFYNKLTSDVAVINHQQSAVLKNYTQQVSIDANTNTLLTKVTYDTSNFLIKTATVSDTPFVSPYGVTEHLGSTTYSQPNLGYSQLISETVTFSRIKWAIKGDATTSITARFYKSAAEFNDKTIAAGSLTLIDSVTIAAGSMQTAIGLTTLQEFDLGENHQIEAGQYLTILVKKLAGTNPTIGRYTSDAGGYRNNFIFVLTGDPWAETWVSSSYPTYCGTPMILLNTELSQYNKTLLRTYIADSTISRINPRILLPDTLYMSAGDTTEYNIYWDNISIVNDYHLYNWVVTCTKGQTFEQGWRYTPPTGTTGTYAFTVVCKDKRNNAPLDTATTTLIISDNTLPSTKSILMVGDSKTAAGGYAAEVYRMSDDSLTMLGTQGLSPGYMEGYSGKTWAWFESDASSPFVDGVGDDISLQTYLTAQGYSDPDYIIIDLGTNDFFSATDANIDATVATAMRSIDSLITNFHADAPSAKIGIFMEIPPSYSQDAFGDDYNNSSTRQFKRNMHRYNEILKATFGVGGSGELSYVSLLPAYLNLDTEHNMSTTATAYNARNSTTYNRQTNGVHPATSGYYQVADIIFGWVVNH